MKTLNEIIKDLDKKNLENISIEAIEKMCSYTQFVIYEKTKEFYCFLKRLRTLNYQWCSFSTSKGIEAKELTFMYNEGFAQFLEQITQKTKFTFLFLDELQFTCNQDVLKFKNGIEFKL